MNWHARCSLSRWYEAVPNRRGQMMDARRLIVFALGAALAGHAPLVRAQISMGAMRSVGVLVPSTRAKEEIILKPFFDEMRQLGWVEGQNIAYDRVYGDDQQQTLPRLAAEMVARKPDLIYAPPAPTALAAKQATQTIPIVFGSLTNPVSLGLVTDLAHPDGNVTGVSSNFELLVFKRAELFLQILPRAKRFGLLIEPGRYEAAALSAWLALGLSLIVAEAANPAELEAAVARLADQRVDVILVQSTLANNLPARVIEPANARRLPVIGGIAQLADAGALFSFGASRAGNLRRSAQLVDKILKGAKPADIPVEQPTVFEFVLNMKTAKALGIKMPQSILLRADRLIE